MDTAITQETRSSMISAAESMLDKSRQKVLEKSTSWAASLNHEQCLGTYNSIASKVISQEQLDTEWKKQSARWLAMPDEKYPKYFPALILAKQQGHKETEGELLEIMTRGRILPVVSPFIRNSPKTHSLIDRPSTMMGTIV